jgi:glycosyltransferase involved in cell wall biosynthesis
MPELFGKISWFKRELGFKMQIWAGRTILLSSNDAKQDCIKFYNVENNYTRVLRFPTVIPQYLLDVEISTLKELYLLPEKFVYIPNQLWLHKNHTLLIDALGILKKQGKKVTIICTGNTKDPRSLEHFSLLQEKITQLKLESDFRILGLIPREHALGLLRTCTLLINPSFFEGWNTSVEEAKAFNVPMILSNIPVHKEQAGDKAYYFEPNNRGDVAQLLYENIQQLAPPNSLRDLNQNTDILIKNFASDFVDLSINSNSSGIISH